MKKINCTAIYILLVYVNFDSCKEIASVKALPQMETALEEIVVDLFRKNSMDHFDYLGWLEEKLNNKAKVS